MNPEVSNSQAARLRSFATLPQLWRQRCIEWGNRPAMRFKRHGVWRTTTWSEYFEQARAIGLALRAARMGDGDVVSILSANRPEWAIFDMAAQAMGGVVQGLYPACGAEDLGRQLVQSRSRIVLVDDDAQLAKVLEVRRHCPDLALIIVAEPGGAGHGQRDPQLVTLAHFIGDGDEIEASRAADFDRAIDAGRPDRPAALVCTAGTTGEPRIAVLTQRNLVHQAALAAAFALGHADRSLSIQSMSHVTERMAAVVHPLAGGHIVHFPESGATILNDLREVAPQLLMGPPRLWDRLKREADITMAGAMPLARRLYESAFKSAGRTGATGRTWRQRLVMPNLRRFIGVHALRVGIVHGAAPTPATQDWFAALGVDLHAGYGLAETSGLFALEPRAGGSSAGGVQPVDGVEVRLDGDGVIRVRGPLVCAGYWGAGPDGLIDPQGWLNTSDAGALRGDGMLMVHDRQDRLIRLRHGTVAPARVEAQFRSSPYISDLLIVDSGNGQVGALVALAPEPVAIWAQQQRIAYAGPLELAAHPEVARLIGKEVERINAGLSPVERVHGFRILPRSFGVDDEEVTPAMTMRQALIEKRYARLIAELHGAPHAHSSLQSQNERNLQ